ncbi:MAG: MFS transporter [Acidobacteriota bacterium]|nr:MFS transporter [Acidobacteriota bacterium]
MPRDRSTGKHTIRAARIDRLQYADVSAADSHDPAAKVRWLPMFAVAGGHFVHDVYFAFFAPLLPLLRERLALSYADAGWLAALIQLPALANPLLGYLADRGGGRWLMVAAPSVAAASMSLIGLAPSRLALGGLLLIAGVGSAFWHVPAPVRLAREAGGRKGTAMSLFMVAGEGARTVGPLLALAVVGLAGPAGLTALMPFGLLTSALLAFVTRDRRGLHRRAATAAAAAPAESWRPLARLFAAVSLVIGGRAFLVGSLATYLPSYVVERGGSLWLGGAALAILQGAGAVGALSSGTLSDRIGRRRILFAVALASPLALFGLARSGPGLMVPLLVLLGLLTFSTNPPLLALVQESAGSRPAVANGIFMTLGFTLRSAALVLVGRLGDTLGLVRAFEIAAFAALLAVAGVLALPRPTDGGVPR